MLEFLQRVLRMSEGEKEGMVMEDQCVVRIQNLDGNLMSIFIGAGILVYVEAVVVVRVVFSTAFTTNSTSSISTFTTTATKSPSKSKIPKPTYPKHSTSITDKEHSSMSLV